jgi:hypothetical protein
MTRRRTAARRCQHFDTAQVTHELNQRTFEQQIEDNWAKFHKARVPRGPESRKFLNTSYVDPLTVCAYSAA